MRWYIRGPHLGPLHTTLASGRIGGRKRRTKAQSRGSEPHSRSTQSKMKAKDIRRLSPETLAYSLAGNDLSADDRAWIREVYGDVPAGCGWHWGDDNFLKRDHPIYGESENDSDRGPPTRITEPPGVRVGFRRPRSAP